MPKLVIGLAYYASYLLPIIVFYLLYSKSKELSSEIKADKGPVGGYSLGTLFSVIFMTSLLVSTYYFI